MSHDSMCPIKMFCPNCGVKIKGYKGGDGALRIDCKKCHIKIFSKKKARHETNIKMRAIK